MFWFSRQTTLPPVGAGKPDDHGVQRQNCHCDWHWHQTRHWRHAGQVWADPRAAGPAQVLQTPDHVEGSWRFHCRHRRSNVSRDRSEVTGQRREVETEGRGAQTDRVSDIWPQPSFWKNRHPPHRNRATRTDIGLGLWVSRLIKVWDVDLSTM